jgi:succinate dehydrogenase / fumarate reductase cytochrome b subunit
MAKSALLKSSIAKKYWMSFTGLFLCVFLLGHLAGNLQLLFGTAMQFNEYALFMTTNPAVKILSYVTYFSILFHAVDGILLTIQNRKARPVGYVKQDAGANSGFAARNMAVLGTLILVFIVTHMVNFWAKMHFDKDMPMMTTAIEVQPGMKQDFYIGTQDGQYFPVDQVKKEGEEAGGGSAAAGPLKPLEIRNRTEIYNTQANVKMGNLYKDLHKITFAFFKDAKFGLIATIGYVLSMIVLGFHLWHGFQSAFVSIGIRNKSWTPRIQMAGKIFSVVVPFLFAIIPICIHFEIFVK